ncbi:MAG: cell wall-active antibiotics response protein LiaF [Chloroflexota bacterium]
MRIGIWQIVIGILLVILGLIGLLNNLGLIAITIGQAIGVVFALGLIALGGWLIWSAVVPQRVPRNINVILGDTTIGRRAWELRELGIQKGIGATRIDLTSASIIDREGRVDISGWVGDVEVLVPAHLAFRARGSIVIGSITMLGRRADGFFRELAYITDDFDSAEKRVSVDIYLGVGQISVIRPE